MPKSASDNRLLDRVWRFFASVKLTVTVLSVLALTSAVGTLVPQNQDPMVYFRQFGATVYRLFELLDLFDMYHSWWFQFLLLTLTVNVVVCSFDRLPAVWKIAFDKSPRFGPRQFKKSVIVAEFAAGQDAAQAQTQAEATLTKCFRSPRIVNDEAGYAVYAEKFRWTRLGAYIVHVSIVLMLLGGLVGSMFGFEGFVNIAEGEQSDVIHLRRGHETRQLDFAIRCDDFDVSFYSNGAPKEFRSTLTLIENQQPALTADIIVNSPLRYQGINIFQSSYGKLQAEHDHQQAPLTVPDKLTLRFTSRASNMRYFKDTVIGQPVDLPENAGKFVLIEYRPQAEFGGQNIGEAFIGVLTPAGGQPVEVLLPLRFANFDKMRGGRFSIAVEGDFHEPFHAEEPPERYYTGLQVTYDPGVLLVYAGFIVMIIGCIVTFFMSHQRYWVDIRARKNKIWVSVRGVSNRHQLGMERKIEKLAHRLAPANTTIERKPQ